GHDSIDMHYFNSMTNNTAAQLPLAQWIHPAIPSSTPYTDSNWNGLPDNFEALHGITSNDQVKPIWTFTGYNVISDAGYNALEMYSAYVAGDFDRLHLDDRPGPDPETPGANPELDEKLKKASAAANLFNG